MPNPITPEMRAALEDVIETADDISCGWFEIGEHVSDRIEQLRALLDALPTVKDSLTAEATTEKSSAVGGRVCMESNFPDTDGPLRRQFLVGGTRYKLASSKNGAKFDGFPAELSGRWVALVAADNDEHLRATPAADHSEDARGMVGERGSFDEVFHSDACQRAGLNRGWRGIGLFVWDAALAHTNSAVEDVIAAAESLARKAESLSDTPEIYPALHALDLAIDAYRAGHSPGAGNVERDAIRYRTVRELHWFAQQICARFGVPSEGLTLEAIDAAIDRRTEALRERAMATTASAAR